MVLDNSDATRPGIALCVCITWRSGAPGAADTAQVVAALNARGIPVAVVGLASTSDVASALSAQQMSVQHQVGAGELRMCAAFACVPRHNQESNVWG